MKIAVSGSQPDLEGDVNPMFGRCEYFLIVDVEGKKVNGYGAVKNMSASQAGAAGISAAQAVAGKGVKAVITGSMGPRALDVMGQFGIEVYAASGPVREAVRNFGEGKLKKIQTPGQMHSGLGRRGEGRGMGRMK